MNRKCLTNLLTVLFILLLISQQSDAAQQVRILSYGQPSARVQFGIDKLNAALQAAGCQAVSSTCSKTLVDEPAIHIGHLGKSEKLLFLINESSLKLKPGQPGKEGYVLATAKYDNTVVAGKDDTGILYGCLELAERIKTAGKIPKNLAVVDTPVFTLRGPCIGMVLMDIIYDDIHYDYLYTPENFPFFYDRQLWTKYLDFLLENRMNTLYLWNGHPFTSLLKLPKYPDAQALPDEQLKQNIEVFNWLTKEADKRGIWVIKNFYNIHISHALAKSRNVPMTYREPTQLTREYTRYCISEFVSKYPHVGVMMCLGERLADEYGADWLCNVIIPGVKDAMKQLDTTDQPPVIVRAHSTPIEEVINAALKIYDNIYTTCKYNGESLTTTNLRSEVKRLHESLSQLGSTHIVNVHLLSNLEPYRWASPIFIQKSMQSCKNMGIRGLHLYPLRYSDWPYSGDNTTPRLLQIKRDWLWFEIWARYAWNPDRNFQAERQHWIDRIAEEYGSKKAAVHILDAYQAFGECAPRLLRRFGITEGGRQALSLGMLMTQLINPDRYGVWKPLRESEAPVGETIAEWVKREWNKQPHHGETPPKVIKETLSFAQQAVTAIEAAKPLVTKNKTEFNRLLNDIYCIQATTRCYTEKVNSAMKVLRYKYSNDIKDLEAALPLLENSLAEYRKLVKLTDTTYLDGDSLHNQHRRIPFIAGPNDYLHFRQCLPEYEKETESLRQKIKRLQTDPSVKIVDWLFEE